MSSKDHKKKGPSHFHQNKSSSNVKTSAENSDKRNTQEVNKNQPKSDKKANKSANNAKQKQSFDKPHIDLTQAVGSLVSGILSNQPSSNPTRHLGNENYCTTISINVQHSLPSPSSQNDSSKPEKLKQPDQVFPPGYSGSQQFRNPGGHNTRPNTRLQHRGGRGHAINFQGPSPACSYEKYAPSPNRFERLINFRGHSPAYGHEKHAPSPNRFERPPNFRGHSPAYGHEKYAPSPDRNFPPRFERPPNFRGHSPAYGHEKNALLPDRNYPPHFEGPPNFRDGNVTKNFAETNPLQSSQFGKEKRSTQINIFSGNHNSRGRKFFHHQGPNYVKGRNSSDSGMQKNQSPKSPISIQNVSDKQNFNPFFQGHPRQQGQFSERATDNVPKNFVSASVEPIYKFIKNKDKKPESQLNVNKDVQRKVKRERAKQYKTNRQKIFQKRSDFRKNKMEKKETVSLFSFQRAPVKADIDVKQPSDSEEEGSTALSRCSSQESIWTTNISDDDSEDNLSDEESETSEMSMSSSVINSESSFASSAIPHVSQPRGFISVFWDIENCPVPHGKSAVDFVKFVRTTFYENHTESSFWVVCDVKKLSDTITKELDLCDANTVHVNGTDKNAADKKIQSLLLEFKKNCQDENLAIVLISSDSDFASILYSLRYKCHMRINLICKQNSKSSLLEVAHKCIFYENIIKNLPSRASADDTEYIIVTSNFPQNMKSKQLKKHLNARLISVNCRLKVLDNNTAEVISQDAYGQERAMSLLKGFKLEGNEITLLSCQRKKTLLSDSIQKQTKHKSKDEKKISEVKTSTEESVSESKDSDKKRTSLYIYVGTRSNDIAYWKDELNDIFRACDFSLQWAEKRNEGFIFAHFDGVKKAQKAKKLLQNAQKTDPLCPKFVKVIKNDDILNISSISFSLDDQMKAKIDEHVRIIESKKEIALAKQKKIVEDMKKSQVPNIDGAAEAVKLKLNELNDHKVTFLNFTQKTIEALRALHLTSDSIDCILDSYLRDYSRECNCLSNPLPIYAKKNIILSKIKKHQVVVIRAETGSGKSTQLTQYIWREQFQNPNVKKSMIVCTQPRKIAAISLAKHISVQIGCTLGDVVGYQVGMASKKSSNTAILYVTDFTMLKMFLKEDIQNITHIIVDEAHERTIHTDVLLGMLKQYLKTNHNLKVVITSATIDTAVFSEFFGIGTEAVLEISGRTFPIEDIWLNQEVIWGWDYFQKAIDTVCDLIKKDPGDILVFLTTPFETERAVKVLTEKLDKRTIESTRILQLHGKLDLQEQQKIFDHTPTNTRKIVFSTNCAETSITIPGVKYVVDCGMVKESHYDAVRNISVLSVNFVSQSSAEQRRGRAGRTNVGTCYRLYSKSNYEKMSKISQPEILQTNLGQALMKLIKIGVKDPLQFDFVQSPPKESLQEAMKQLVGLDAVCESEMTLSEKGEFMSLLPLEPRLSNMVYSGMQQSLGFEVVVVAALVTVSRSIFFRSTNNKLESDTKKMRFCQSDSDFLSYLAVYKEWSSVPKNVRNKWCMANSINSRSLRSVQELINEIMLIIEHEANIKISPKFKDELSSDILLRIFYQSFFQNLCIFSGSHKFGYRSTKVLEDLQVHPSSSLHTFGQNWRPRFLVYDTLLKTNQTYMINISPVSEEFIDEDLIDFLKELELQTYCISPIGKSIIVRDIIGKKGCKLKELRDSIGQFVQNNNMDFVVNADKGQVKIIGPRDIGEIIEKIFTPLIIKAQDEFLAEQKDIFIEPELCAVFSSGAEILEVVLPGEYRDLKVVLRQEVDISLVIKMLEKYGPIRAVREFKSYFKVSFLSPAHAEMALLQLKEQEMFSLNEILKSNYTDGNLSQYKLRFSFLRRECTGIAYVSVDPAFVTDFIDILRMKLQYYHSNLLSFSLCRKSSDIRITGLPLNTERSELEKLIKSSVPETMKLTKFLLVRKKEYESTKEELVKMKNDLMDTFYEFASHNSVTIDIKKPHPKHVKWMSIVYFQNPYSGQAAYTALKQKRYASKFCGLEIEAVIQSFLYCKLEVFNAIKNQLVEASDFFKSCSDIGNTLEINAEAKGPKVEIQITSNNVTDMQDARRFLTNLLLGDKIDCSEYPRKHLFSSSGRSCLKSFCDGNPDCYINVDEKKATITIFSNQTACSLLMCEIQKFLDDLVQQNFQEIPLMPQKGQPRILRELLRTYGPELKGLKEKCGLSDVKCDIYKHILQIRGSRLAVDKCVVVIDELKSKEILEVNEDAEICPVCFDQTSEKFYRLECCGHAYCRDCILHLFQSACEFPIICVEENCGLKVVLADVKWAEKEIKCIEKDLSNRALTDFVQKREDVEYCPTTDCSMIYRVGQDEKVYQCPSCHNSICRQCGVHYHFGMSCSMYKCTQENSDYSLKVWMEQNPENRKQCPSCSSPIEKNGGCNHMTCWKCKQHMCWQCLQLFKHDTSVYEHQPFCPKLRSK